MSIKLGVVMDPIARISAEKDTTLALLLAAQARGWDLSYMEMGDLRLSDGKPSARMRHLAVEDAPTDWYQFNGETDAALRELDVILMRKDPPFDMEYIYTTYLLEQAEREGVLIVNKPQSLRDASEKLFTAWFPHCCPPTLVARDARQFRSFLSEHQEVIFKPLDGMGGASIFRAAATDPNVSVIIETLTDHGSRYAMAQRFLPEIADGDKRLLLINGISIGYSLARIPSAGETRGNLAAGGSGEGRPLSDRDRWICDQVGPELKRRGLIFVGLDVIGDYLTEINVTSPTCARELDRIYDINIGATLMDAIEQMLG